MLGIANPSHLLLDFAHCRFTRVTDRNGDRLQPLQLVREPWKHRSALPSSKWSPIRAALPPIIRPTRIQYTMLNAISTPLHAFRKVACSHKPYPNLPSTCTFVLRGVPVREHKNQEQYDSNYNLWNKYLEPPRYLLILSRPHRQRRSSRRWLIGWPEERREFFQISHN